MFLRVSQERTPHVQRESLDRQIQCEMFYERTEKEHRSYSSFPHRSIPKTLSPMGNRPPTYLRKGQIAFDFNL